MASKTFICLQKVDYQYNIRGWLTAINDISNLTQGTYARDLFAFKINYDTVENTINGNVQPLYNGNISETLWVSDKDNIKRKYGYKYDALNRLLNAYYQKPSLAVPVTNSYNEEIAYDKNGNITTLNRFGDLDSSTDVIQIDKLQYTYATNSNQLMKVFDEVHHPVGFKDDSTDGITDPVDDFAYDSNGNMISDQNKGIISIKYNHLNLPIEIVFSNAPTKKINYIYNSAGVKVKKTVTDGTTLTYTDYLSGFQYTQVGTGTVALNFFPHAEGYVSCAVVSGNNVYNYVFHYTDHLGNIRVSYAYNTATSSLKILEENHYYPFGMKHTKYNTESWQFVSDPTGGYNTGVVLGRVDNSRNIYQYKYNGKEYQDELGLNVYDMDMRQYDPAIARWIVQDPVVHYNFTPYNAFDNNPVFWADPSGADANSMFGSGVDGERRYDNYGAFIPKYLRETVTSNDGSTNYYENVLHSNGNNITALELALLAKHVYGETNELPEGWEVVNHKLFPFLIYDDERSGLKAEMYAKVVNGETQYALVYAGTQEITIDGIEDLKQVTGNSRQYEIAVSNAKELNDRGYTNKTIYSGHSLGGGLANASALAFGGTAVTFNPAWISDATRYKHTLSNKNANIINYVIAGEVLDLAQRAYGRHIGLRPSGTTDYLRSWELFKKSGTVSAHKIQVVIDALKN